jgi:hypothetical protein
LVIHITRVELGLVDAWRRLFREVPSELVEDESLLLFRLGDPAEIHKRLRDPHTGRINPRNLKHPYPVDAAALRALKRELLQRVGELAAGWNAGVRSSG